MAYPFDTNNVESLLSQMRDSLNTLVGLTTTMAADVYGCKNLLTSIASYDSAIAACVGTTSAGQIKNLYDNAVNVLANTTDILSQCGYLTLIEGETGGMQSDVNAIATELNKVAAGGDASDKLRVQVIV